MPTTIRFPPVRLLFGLGTREESAAKTPLWLLIVRLVLAALVILAAAHPLLNADTRLTGKGPLIVLIDDGWAAASNWPARRILLGGFADQAERQSRPVVVITTAAVENESGGTRGYHFSRQQNGTVGGYEVEVYGTKGYSSAKNRHAILGKDDAWRFRGENNDMYQTEHNELFASIREGNPFNDGEIAAQSTMVAILGRMAAYTGQQITYEDALNSKLDLTPEHLDWKKDLAVPEAPVPGVTRFI